MAKKVYFSPSNHGVNQNKCLKSGCYEDKHTRPMAEACAKYLEKYGIETKIAGISTSVMNGARKKEADKWGADLYIPIHTNAASASARYLLFMFYRDNSTYRKIFNAVAPHLEAIYPNNTKAHFSARPDLYEIKTPNAKTLYCEMGFHTNKTDVENFIHNTDAIGKALAKGICEYFGVAFKDDVAKPSTSTPVKKPDVEKKKVVDEDGIWGKGTTQYTQKFFNTTADGIVSNQLNNCKKYLINVVSDSWKFSAYANGGSPMIKKLQKYVGAPVDGYAGKTTVKLLQEFLKKKKLYTGSIDGIMGSGTVKAWQKFINQQF